MNPVIVLVWLLLLSAVSAISDMKSQNCSSTGAATGLQVWWSKASRSYDNCPRFTLQLRPITNNCKDDWENCRKRLRKQINNNLRCVWLAMNVHVRQI